MIIYQRQKPVDCTQTNCVGVTGDNLANIQSFLIKGVSDEALSYTIHLRFQNGAVNSVKPDEVKVDDDGTLISWKIKKNDIFSHGFFDVQLEGRNASELIIQTEIVQLYADESLPVEDKAYENPNSETILLRDEAYSLLQDIFEQQTRLEENMEEIEKSDINLKADKATTLAGYGITDAYTKDEVKNKLKLKADDYGFDSVPTLGSPKYVNSGRIYEALLLKADTANVYTKTQADTMLKSKADKATTLEGYGITDSYTKNEVSQYFVSKAQGETLAHKATTLAGYGITDSYTKAEDDTLLAQKYDSANIESGSGTLTPSTSTAAERINSAEFTYQKVGGYVTVCVTVNLKAFTPASASNNISLTGLPYICKNAVNLREICVTTAKTQMLYAVSTNTSNLTLLFFNVNPFSDGETLSFTVTYKI